MKVGNIVIAKGSTDTFTIENTGFFSDGTTQWITLVELPGTTFNVDNFTVADMLYSTNIQQELQAKFPVSESDPALKEWENSAVGNEFGAPCVGAQQSARHNSGKTQLREIDPAFILGLGQVLTASREKYEEGNWQRETKLSTPYESCMRHLMKYWSGEQLDNETQMNHLLHAATNIMFLYYHETSGKGIDDRLFKKEKK